MTRPQTILRTTPSPGRAAVAAAVLAVGLLLVACGGATTSHGARDQMKFGVRMAQQGLWNEALFRFEKARGLDPGNAQILNNLAVALEAAGRYEDAMEAYQEALRLAPGNRDLRDNYARFADFYQSFRPTPEEGGEGEEATGS